MRETYDFFLFIKQRRAKEPGSESPQAATARPDFPARQQGLSGSRMLSDSQAILDELRADRF